MQTTQFRVRLTYANVISTIALFVALGGSAFAITKLAKNSVKSKQIAAGAVKTADIATDAVTGAQIKDGTVTAIDLAKGTITAAEIADGTLTAAELASGSVGGSEVIDNAITAAEIADGTITAGELSSGSVSTGKVANDAITAAQIADGTVTAAELGPGSVGAAKIAADAVGSAAVGSDALTGADVDESTLGTVPTAASATNATNASNAANAASLGGRPASSYGPPIMLGRINDLGTGSSPNLTPVGLVSDVNAASSTIAPAPFVARDLRVALVGGPLAAGQTRTISIVKAGVATPLTCTIPAGGTSCQNTTDDVSYAPGNQIAITLAATGAPTATQDIQYSYSVAPE